MRARSVWAPGGIAAGAGLGLVLARLPLLDGLTYELAVAVAVIVFFAGIVTGAVLGGNLDAPHPLRWKLLATTPRERVEPGLLRGGLALALVVLGAALVPIVNGERQGCAWEAGIPVYLFVTLPAIPLGLGLGLFARVAAGRKLWRQAAIVLLVVAGMVCLTLGELLFGPRAVLHSLILGIATSSAYLGFDEGVRIASSDWLHRTAAVVVAALLLALALALAAARGREAVGEERERVKLLLGEEMRRSRRHAVFCLLLLAVMVAIGDEFGFGTGERTLRRELAAVHRTDHFELHYRPGSPVERLAPELGRDCEWEYARIGALLGLADPTAAGNRAAAPIRVFIYQDAAEREAITGAAGYLFAKPWRGELNTDLDARGELTALAHELTHVIAGRFGLPLIKISARYGLIEGIAEGVAGGYAERPWRHEVVAAALRVGLLPRAEELLGGLGFAASDARVSYEAAASFCGFLLARHGAAPLRAVYAWGDFAAAYGKSLAALDREWREFLAAVPVGDAALALAARSFDRRLNPPFFRRACARLGFRSGAGGAAAAVCRLPWECGGVAGFEQALSRLDGEAAAGPLAARDGALALLGRALARADRLAEAAEVFRRRLDLGAVAPPQRGVLEVFAADPALARAMWSPDDAVIEAVIAPEPTAEGITRVLAAARQIDRDQGYATLAPLVAGLGGCAPELTTLEASVLVRAAVRARRAGDLAAAHALAETAASLAGASPDVRADAAIERERVVAMTSGLSPTSG